MLIFNKEPYQFIIEKSSESLLIKVKNKNIRQIFGILKDSSIVIYLENRWNKIDTNTLKYDIKYNNKLDKSSKIILFIIEKFNKDLKFNDDELNILQAIIYDTMMDLELCWFPEGLEFTFLPGIMEIKTDKNHSTFLDLPSKLGIDIDHWVTYNNQDTVEISSDEEDTWDASTIEDELSRKEDLIPYNDPRNPFFDEEDTEVSEIEL